ncbi:DNA annealing helicase and endonuclease ZRANB3-like [Planoprotostelium fungivorum]|uniref:DNA annealing helicase and endonuclease ZRANB3-like n=1 Tax=Planoprotostelium fungivorum TaxID=1890364 RepID=A0A2P6NRC9_9EUKA|nr:DNA annealing helicase and endonuclease ZRANB3-like [Planoprotostelium fungivorum]
MDDDFDDVDWDQIDQIARQQKTTSAPSVRAPSVTTTTQISGQGVKPSVYFNASPQKQSSAIPRKFTSNAQQDSPSTRFGNPTSSAQRQQTAVQNNAPLSNVMKSSVKSKKNDIFPTSHAYDRSTSNFIKNEKMETPGFSLGLDLVDDIETKKEPPAQMAPKTTILYQTIPQTSTSSVPVKTAPINGSLPIRAPIHPPINRNTVQPTPHVPARNTIQKTNSPAVLPQVTISSNFHPNPQASHSNATSTPSTQLNTVTKPSQTFNPSQNNVPCQLTDKERHEKRMKLLSAGAGGDIKFTILDSETMSAVSVQKSGILDQFFQDFSEATLCTEGIRQWKFPISLYEQIGGYFCREWKRDAPPAKVVELLVKRNFQSHQQEMKNQRETINLDKVPAELLSRMLPFQREGLKFGIQQKGRCLIADEPGLGKTIQAISISTYYKEDWPVLVACPASLRDHWRNEYLRWIPELHESNVVIVDNGKRQIDESCKVVITSWQLLKHFEKHNFQIIIGDESHTIKSWTTNVTRIALPMFKRSKRVILLSGTPMFSKPAEVWPQIDAIDPKLFNNFYNFGRRYCDPREGFHGTDWTGASHLNELYMLLNCTIMIRRLKKDVQQELPKKTRLKVHLEIGKEQRKVLDKINENLISARKARNTARDRETLKEASFQTKTQITQSFQNTGRAKLPAVIKYIKQVLSTEKDDEGKPVKILVFAHHKDPLEGIESALYNAKYPSILIYGETPSVDRQRLVDYFQNDPECRAAILSIKAAGVGLTLTAATVVIFAELYWNPGQITQAEDRAHRIGQKKPVDVRFLLAEGSIDSAMWDIIDRKESILGNTLNGEAGNVLEISSDEKFIANNQQGLDEMDFLQRILDKVAQYEETDQAFKDRRARKRARQKGDDSYDADLLSEDDLPKEEPAKEETKKRKKKRGLLTRIEDSDEETPSTAVSPSPISFPSLTQVAGPRKPNLDSFKLKEDEREGDSLKERLSKLKNEPKRIMVNLDTSEEQDSGKEEEIKPTPPKPKGLSKLAAFKL